MRFTPLCSVRGWIGLLLLVSGGFLLSGGCGGGGGGDSKSSPTPTPSGQSSGSARLVLQWPSRTGRLVPLAAQSVVVVFEDAAHKELARAAAVRPSDDTSTSEVRFTTVPVGDYFVTATAYPNSDGTGVVQGQSTVPVSISSGTEASLTLSLQSTITSVALEPATVAALPVGQTAGLTVVARNASGAVVLTHARQFGWQAANAGIASVSANGVVTGQAAGQTTVSVRDTESGNSAQVVVQVVGPL